MIGSLVAGLVAASFLALGAGSLVAPRTLAANYGLPVEDAAGVAYLRAVGARDAVLGLLVLASLRGGSRDALATTLALCALVGAADFTLVRRSGAQLKAGSLTIHAGGTLGLLAAAVLVRTGA